MNESAAERKIRADRLRPLVEKKAGDLGWSRLKVARDIGVTDTALNQFLVGSVPFSPTLDLYESWVERESGTNGTDPSPDEVRAEAERYRRALRNGEGVSWVPRLIEKVLDSAEEGRVKLALIEVIVAGGRNHTAYGESMAAVQRGLAMELESGAANGRNHINQFEAEEARKRREAVQQPDAGRTAEDADATASAGAVRPPSAPRAGKRKRGGG